MKRYLVVALVFLSIAVLVGVTRPVTVVGNDGVAVIYTYQRATGAAAIDDTLAPGVPYKLIGFKLHLSAAGGSSENFTLTVNADTAAAYDIVLHSTDMNALTDKTNFWNPPLPFIAGDEIDAAWANSNTKTYGLEWIYVLDNTP